MLINELAIIGRCLPCAILTKSKFYLECANASKKIDSVMRKHWWDFFVHFHQDFCKYKFYTSKTIKLCEHIISFLLTFNRDLQIKVRKRD